MHVYRPGDAVVYTKTKYGVHPGPRARVVRPAERGDEYSYVVEKFWTVAAVEGGLLVLRTRRGKTHRLRADSPNLRPASWWERWRYRDRFPAPGDGAASSGRDVETPSRSGR